MYISHRLLGLMVFTCHNQLVYLNAPRATLSHSMLALSGPSTLKRPIFGPLLAFLGRLELFCWFSGLFRCPVSI